LRDTRRGSGQGSEGDNEYKLLIGEAQILREAGRGAEALAALDEGLAHHPDQPDLLYESALIAERIGRLDVLDGRLKRLLQLKPDHAHAYNALGYSLLERNGDLEEAQRLIDKAVALSPDDPFILDSKGWVLFRRGNMAGALDALQKAFAIRADPEIAAHLGEVLWAMGRKDEAKSTWRKGAEASPANDVLSATVKRLDR
jgi:Flp pilus assembly protein TadD